MTVLIKFHFLLGPCAKLMVKKFVRRICCNKGGRNRVLYIRYFLYHNTGSASVQCPRTLKILEKSLGTDKPVLFGE